MGAKKLKNYENDQEIDLIPLSDEEIDQRQLKENDLWFMMILEVPRGPYATIDLKTYFEEHPDFDRRIKLASQSAPTTWRAIFEYPNFKIRKPQLVQEDIPACHDNFHMIKDGKPFGPISVDEVLSMVENKEILYTDSISIDAGDNWMKLHQHPRFNRRYRAEAEDLPYMPDAKTFAESKKESFLTLKSKPNAQTQEEFISLAKVHRQNGETETTLDLDQLSNDDKKRKSLSQNIFIVFICLLIVGGAALYRYLQNEMGITLIPSSSTTQEKVSPENKATSSPKKATKAEIIKAKKTPVSPSRKKARTRNIRRSKVQTKKQLHRNIKKEETLLDKELENDIGDEVLEAEKSNLELDAEQAVEVDDEGLIGERDVAGESTDEKTFDNEVGF